MCRNDLHANQEKNDCPFLNPAAYLYGDDERRRFESYQKGLAEETDILEVWRWYSKDFFPFDLEAYIDAMDKFLPDNVEGFAKHCNMLRAPSILHELFACARKKHGDAILLEFMAKAPICASQDKNGDWFWDGSSFAAPTMLDFLFDLLLQDNPINKEIDEKKATTFTQKIGKTLLNRKDRYFLVWNYVKYLLSSNIKNQDVTSLFIENIGQICKPILETHYGEKDWLKALRPKGFTLKDNRERFSQTGLLGATGKESMYLNLLTQMQFYDKENLDDYLPCFEDSLLLKDEMLKAFSPKPLLCHYYISDIYLASKDPITSWHTTWKKMCPARYRIWFNRYDEFSIDIERNLNFLLIVGISMIERLYPNDDEGDSEKGATLCETLLAIVSGIINKQGDKASQLNQEMLEYLVTWRFMFYEAEEDSAVASDKIAAFILDHNCHPRRILEMLSVLKANGFLPNLQAGNETTDAFYAKIMWAAEFAIAQEKCEYRLAARGNEIRNWAMGLRGN